MSHDLYPIAILKAELRVVDAHAAELRNAIANLTKLVPVDNSQFGFLPAKSKAGRKPGPVLSDAAKEAKRQEHNNKRRAERLAAKLAKSAVASALKEAA